MSEVLVAGETLVDFLPGEAGPLAQVETFSRLAGGAPANVAVALARLDEPPLFWTRLGRDPFGDFLATTLAAESIPGDYVERDPDAKTGLAFVSLGADADREFSFHRDGSADTRLQPGAVPDETLDAVSWVHVGGVTLADEPAREATLDLMSRAREAGATVSFDPNARPELWTDFDFADSMDRAFSLADVVKATPEDLAAMGAAGDPEALAGRVRDAGAHTALITLGRDGSYGVAGDQAPWGPAVATHGGYAVDPVDTTGAGDAFTAGAIAALGAGESLAETLAFANAVAAVATTAAGAMAALPDRAAVTGLRARD